jgi:hypothetical protein
MKSPKAPAAPDPVATAQAQTAMNKETAIANARLNNVNQITPYGELKYSETLGADGTPTFTSTTTLSPAQQAMLESENRSNQALLNLGEAQLGRIEQSAATPFSYDNMPAVYGEGDTEKARLMAEEAIMSRMNPQFQRDEESMRTRLINQGIGQGSEAYDREMARFGQTKNDARQQAILSSQNYASGLLQDSLTRRNQGIQEYTTQRNAPLNEYSAFTSGTQIQNPQFQNIGYNGASEVDYANLVNQNYQGQLNNYNQKMAGRNSLISGIAGIAGTAAGGFLGGPAGAAIGGSLFGGATK